MGGKWRQLYLNNIKMWGKNKRKLKNYKYECILKETSKYFSYIYSKYCLFSTSNKFKRILPIKYLSFSLNTLV